MEELLHHLWRGSPGFLRTLGAVSLLPLGDGIEVQKRIILGTLGGIVFWGMGQPAPFGEIFPLLSELLLGFLIGLPFVLVIQAFEMGGELFDTGRGQTIGVMYDPVHAESISHMSFLAKWWMVALLYSAGLFPELFSTIARSFDALPRLEMRAAFTNVRFESLFPFVLSLLRGAFRFGFSFGIIYFLIEISIGVAAKVLPGVSLTSEAYLAKSVVSFLVLLSLISFDMRSGFLCILDATSHVLF